MEVRKEYTPWERHPALKNESRLIYHIAYVPGKNRNPQRDRCVKVEREYRERR